MRPISTKTSRPRRAIRAGAVLAAAALLATAMVAATPAAAARHTSTRRHSRASQLEQTYMSRALASYAAMQRVYWSSPDGLYLESGTYSSAWSYSQAMAATVSVAALPGMHGRMRAALIAVLNGLHAYGDTTDPAPAGYESSVAPPLGAGGDRFNDDNNWIGIELLRLYHVDRNPQLLTAADQIFQMVVSQWDSDPAKACPGGAPWRSFVPDSQRNTVTNSTAAELGAQLYITTHSAADLTWAQRLYEWVRSCLQNPDGLYSDNVSAQGIDNTEWSYNQGTMIGAGVMLYQATRDPSYLQQASATGRAALHAYDAGTLATQGDGFNAIYIRNLLLLGGAAHDPRFASFARWYANDAWRNVRDSTTNLFRSGPGGDTNLLDQAAFTQVYALLAQPTPAYF